MGHRSWIATALFAAVGCGATTYQLQNRAAVDFNCQSSKITARELDSETRIATGCGKEAVYVQHCNGRGHEGCTWMLNSEIRKSSSARQ
jgi:hypothetical protein